MTRLTSSFAIVFALGLTFACSSTDSGSESTGNGIPGGTGDDDGGDPRREKGGGGGNEMPIDDPAKPGLPPVVFSGT